MEWALEGQSDNFTAAIGRWILTISGETFSEQLQRYEPILFNILCSKYEHFLSESKPEFKHQKGHPRWLK